MMRRHGLAAVMLAVGLGTLAMVVAAELPAPVAAVVAAKRIPASGVSVYVQELSADEPLVSYNALEPRNPASTIKLLTTWLALEELGPAYTWPTRAWLDGELERGTLRGNLVIKGYGDPYFITERLWRFQRELRLRGLRSIDGDLVIDNTYFADEYGDPAAFDGRGMRVYNVNPDAFMVNFQSVRFLFLPDRVRQKVIVAADPMPANLVIENQLQLAGGYCGGFQNGVKIEAEPSPLRDRVKVSGRYREGCEEYSLTRAVLTAPTYAYGVFRSLWEEAGGKLAGELRLGTLPADRSAAGELAVTRSTDPEGPFVQVDSPPLVDVISYINKFSNNVMARHLFLTMGAEAFGAPATLDKARRAAKEALAERGLDFPELRLDNGAGLSRGTRIAARSLATVLSLAERRPWFSEFESSLSLPGLDGTMRKRFADEELSGQMHLKTGRLNDVFATAGYVHARSGRDYVVVILQNYPGADKGPGEAAQLELLRWVYEQ